MAVSAIGIMEKALPAFRTLVELYYPPIASSYTIADSETRIASTLQHYSGLGAYLAFTIILVLVCCVAPKRLNFSPWFLIITLLLNSMALILTGTFATLIGLAVGMAIIFLVLRRIPRLVVLTLIGSVLAIFLFQSFISSRLNQELGAGAMQGLVPQSFAFRITLWQQIFLPAVSKYFLFGAGPAPTVLNNWPSEETQYLYLLLRGGLLYFLSYFLLMGIGFFLCWRQITRPGNDATRLVAIALLAILFCLNIMNISGSYFTYAGGTQIIWLLLALLMASQQVNTPAVAVTSSPLRQQLKSLPSPALPRIALASVPDGLMIGSVISPGEPAARRDEQRRGLASLIRLPDWHFVKDSVVVGAGSTIARILGLLFWILLARFLTPTDVGLVRYTTTLAGIIAIVATASPVSLARFLAARRDDQQAQSRYLSNGLFGVALLTAGSLLLSLPILWMLHSLNPGSILCMVGLIGFFFYFAVARGMNSAWKMGLAYILSNSVQLLALVIILGFFKIQSVTVALIIYGSTFLTPFLIEFIRPSLFRFRPSLISMGTLLELGRFALPVVTSSAVYTIWFGTDILLIENFTPDAAGSYAAAKTLAGAFIFIPTAINLVLMPSVAHLALEKSQRYVAGGVLAAIGLCLFGLVIVAVGGQQLLSLTFGHQYAGAYLSLLVLCVGMSFYSIYIVLEGFVIGRGWPLLAVNSLIFALISTAGTGFWLVPGLGALGASLSFTIGAFLSSITMLLLTWLSLNKEKRLMPKKQVSVDLAADSVK